MTWNSTNKHSLCAILLILFLWIFYNGFVVSDHGFGVHLQNQLIFTRKHVIPVKCSFMLQQENSNSTRSSCSYEIKEGEMEGNIVYIRGGLTRACRATTRRGGYPAVTCPDHRR